MKNRFSGRLRAFQWLLALLPVALGAGAAMAEPVVSNYYLLAIGNEAADVDKNDALAAWLKKFHNWRGRQTYTGDDPAKRGRPLWLLDNQDGNQVGALLDSYEANHAIAGSDVFIFYYAGHSTRVADQATDATGRDEDDQQDEALFKAGTGNSLRDDDLASKIAAIGNDDTLKIVILDTCNAAGFATGSRDLRSTSNVAVFFSTVEGERCETTRWLDSIVRAGGIGDIDKGATNDGLTEAAGNNQVTFQEWADWSIALARSGSHEVPGYSFDNMGDAQWGRPVLVRELAEPGTVGLIAGALALLGALRRRRGPRDGRFSRART